MRLLVSMARNKLASAGAGSTAETHIGRTTEEPAALAAVASDEPSPSRVLAGRELLAQVCERLDDRERELAELRAAGLAWADIAKRVGGSPQAQADAIGARRQSRGPGTATGRGGR